MVKHKLNIRKSKLKPIHLHTEAEDTEYKFGNYPTIEVRSMCS